MSPIEEHKEFYRNIGVALTQWAHVELGLFRIFNACLGHPDYSATSIVFYSVVTFQGKMSLVNELLHYRYKGTDYPKEWNKIHERLKRLSRSRNHLAHYSVIVHTENLPGKRYELRPVVHNEKDPNAKPRLYYVHDFPSVWASFTKVALTMENFAARLSGEQELFPPEVC